MVRWERKKRLGIHAINNGPNNSIFDGSKIEKILDYMGVKSFIIV